jgi:hypothetical protein
MVHATAIGRHLFPREDFCTVEWDQRQLWQFGDIEILAAIGAKFNTNQPMVIGHLKHSN